MFLRLSAPAVLRAAGKLGLGVALARPTVQKLLRPATPVPSPFCVSIDPQISDHIVFLEANASVAVAMLRRIPAPAPFRTTWAMTFSIALGRFSMDRIRFSTAFVVAPFFASRYPRNNVAIGVGPTNHTSWNRLSVQLVYTPAIIESAITLFLAVKVAIWRTFWQVNV